MKLEIVARDVRLPEWDAKHMFQTLGVVSDWEIPPEENGVYPEIRFTPKTGWTFEHVAGVVERYFQALTTV